MELTSRRHTVADIERRHGALLHQRLDGRIPGRPADRGAHRRHARGGRAGAVPASARSSRTARSR